MLRANGVTPAERYLQRLCDRSFLSLFELPQHFRDQRSSGKGDGKELCDLLVVFGDDVPIVCPKIAPVMSAPPRFAQLKFTPTRFAPLSASLISGLASLHRFQPSTPLLSLASCFESGSARAILSGSR